MARKKTDKTKVEELREFYEGDLWEFAKYLNPHYYYGEIHREVFKWLSGDAHNQLLLMPRGHLKALRLDQKVLTPSGWVETGDLKAGDVLYGADGLTQTITHLHPISEMDIYEVEFSDGRKVYCNDEHLWTLTCPSNTGRKQVTKPLKEIIKNYKSKRLDKRSGKEFEECRYFLQPPLPIEHEEKEFNIDPYTLGLWLGDGDSRTGIVTSFDPEVFDYVPYKSYEIPSGRGKYRIEGLTNKLNRAGLLQNKHIPDEYFFGSVLQRLELLQGLMDSDGTVHKQNNNQAFCTISVTLRDQFIALVRSLGGKATWCECETGYGTEGRFTAFFVNVWMPDGIVPFKLTRKAGYVRTGQRLDVALKNITKVERAQARCITVSNPDGLFITEDYVVTHNSHCIAVWTVWQITRDPCTTLVYLSAGEDLANAQVYAIKNMFESDQYRLLWPEMLNAEEGKRDKWTAWAFNVDHPLRKARGIRDNTVIVKTVKSNATGLHCSHLVFDDIVVPANAYSETGRKDVEQAVSQFASILSTGGITKAVGTRYHPKDIYQSLADAEIPEYEDPATGELVPPSKLWEVKEFKLENIGDGTGEYLWPRGMHPATKAWFGFDAKERAFILAKYRSMNETTQFYAQYYNDPNDPSSHRVSREKFQYYDKKHLSQTDGIWYFKDKKLAVFCAMDVAWTVGKRSDYTAIAVIGIDHEGFIYLLELDQFKTDKYHVYYERVIGLHHKWGFRKIRVETNSGGKFVAEELQTWIRQNGDSLAVDGKAKTSHDQAKAERHAAVLETRYENQAIWHYKGGYIDAYEEQLILERPPHDDLLDAVSAAIEISKPPGRLATTGVASNVKYIVPNSRFGGIRRAR